MAQTGVRERVAAVRRFNRFYTQRIGVLQEGWVKSPFSLAEARVIIDHEVPPRAHNVGPFAEKRQRKCRPRS